MLLGDFAVSPLGWRYAPLVPALAVVALFALACGEEEVTVTPAPTPTIIQGTKPENPDEPRTRSLSTPARRRRRDHALNASLSLSRNRHPARRASSNQFVTPKK